MTNTTVQMSEEQAVHLVRNALVVAGMEMGAEGDHWPVIKSTVHAVMKDFENLKVERAVFREVHTQFHAMIRELQTVHDESPRDLQPQIQDAIRQLQELYQATFAPANTVYIDPENVPAHIQRADLILKTLEQDDE